MQRSRNWIHATAQSTYAACLRANDKSEKPEPLLVEGGWVERSSKI